LGQRSRKRRRAGDQPAPAAPASRATRTPSAPPAAPPSRTEARNVAARAQLDPLAEGERPTAVTVAAAIAVLMALANLAAAAAGATPTTKNAGSYLVVSTVLLVGAAYGMWQVRYWGVLGFEAILAFQILTLSIALVKVRHWWAGLIVVGVIASLGWLFWKLVRAMARIQMPARR